jgi:hypothetical protein
VQLVGAIIWLIIEPPAISEIYPYPLTAVLTCRVSTFALMMSLVYNMLLILMCTLYAFKTRKIPENFNEAKYIGFTMYSTCIVWLAFIPIYFGTNNDYKVSDRDSHPDTSRHPTSTSDRATNSYTRATRPRHPQGPASLSNAALCPPVICN